MNKNNYLRLLFLTILVCPILTFAQNENFKKLLLENSFVIEKKSDGKFKGEGWKTLEKKIKETDYFMIGESHFNAEVPEFIDAVQKRGKYKTFVMEVSPMLADVLQEKIENSDENKLNVWLKENGNNISFYSHKEDFQLLKNLIKNKVDFLGLDQISALSDITLYRYHKENASDEKLQDFYATVIKNWEQGFDKMIKGEQAMPYLISETFVKDYDYMKKEKMENSFFEKLDRSNNIYRGGAKSHEMRVSDLKLNLKNNYKEHINRKKVLFRFGANHCNKNEDIGQQMFEYAKENKKKSFHLAVICITGETGSPLKVMPNTTLQKIKQMEYFYDVFDSKYTYVDLSKITNTPEFSALENPRFKKFIEGYDAIVIIQDATPATKF
ncbi:hypothetical protein [Aureivirga sp. CE67]|uniref:hypothetical protein n=1 Tax=Aureivirga sp. CE67 TaxID=1788983 RepID=UPI0018CBD199|nr:hypothetical protein [Aureivirga sp. CE67]